MICKTNIKNKFGNPLEKKKKKQRSEQKEDEKELNMMKTLQRKMVEKCLVFLIVATILGRRTQICRNEIVGLKRNVKKRAPPNKKSAQMSIDGQEEL